MWLNHLVRANLSLLLVLVALGAGAGEQEASGDGVPEDFRRAGLELLDRNLPQQAKKLFQQAAREQGLSPQLALETRTYLAESLLGCVLEHIEKYPEVLSTELQRDVEEFNQVLRMLGREAPQAFVQGLRDINAYAIQHYRHDVSDQMSNPSSTRPAFRLSTTVSPDGASAEHAVENAKLSGLELISTTNWNRDMLFHFDGNVTFRLPNISFSHEGAEGVGQLFEAVTPPWCTHQEAKLTNEYLHHKTAADGVQLSVFKDGFVGEYLYIVCLLSFDFAFTRIRGYYLQLVAHAHNSDTPAGRVLEMGSGGRSLPR
jgi:hypothetical protein